MGKISYANKIKLHLFQKVYADDFIRCAYRGILGRDPDAMGYLAHRKSLVDSGKYDTLLDQKLEHILSEAIKSEEFRQKNAHHEEPRGEMLSLHKKIQGIPSTTHLSECLLIQELATKLPANSVVVETGTGAGCVTSVIALAIAGKGSTLYTVDNYSQLGKYGGYGDWSPRTAKDSVVKLKVDGHVRFIEGNSPEVGHAYDKPIDMLYLDSTHRYAEVCQEIDAWYPHVKPGGIIAGHDFDPNCNDGRNVIKAVFDKLLVNPDKPLNVKERVWWLEK